MFDEGCVLVGGKRVQWKYGVQASGLLVLFGDNAYVSNYASLLNLPLLLARRGCRYCCLLLFRLGLSKPCGPSWLKTIEIEIRLKTEKSVGTSQENWQPRKANFANR